MGLTPDLVTGVWSGCEDRAAHFRTIQYGQGANMALPVFAEFMKRLYADSINLGVYASDFDIPNYIEEKLDCKNHFESKENEEFE